MVKSWFATEEVWFEEEAGQLVLVLVWALVLDIETPCFLCHLLLFGKGLLGSESQGF